MLKMITALTTILLLPNNTINAKTTLPKVIPITTDEMIPETIRAIWTNGYEGCDVEKEDVSDMVNGLRISFPDDPDGSALYILLCGGPAAYNKPFVIFTHDQNRDFSRPVILPVMTNEGPSVQTEIYNMKWNSSKRQLSAFGKDRGLADCGIKYIWKWPHDTINSEFVLVEQRTKIDCDGLQDNFPIVWPPQKRRKIKGHSYQSANFTSVNSPTSFANSPGPCVPPSRPR